MAGLGASGVATKIDGVPRCNDCDRNLRAMSEGRYFCPCCGEIFMLLEALMQTDVPNDHGWVRTGLARGRNDAHFSHMSGPCDNAVQHRLERMVEQPRLNLKVGD